MSTPQSKIESWPLAESILDRLAALHKLIQYYRHQARDAEYGEVLFPTGFSPRIAESYRSAVALLEARRDALRAELYNGSGWTRPPAPKDLELAKQHDRDSTHAPFKS